MNTFARLGLAAALALAVAPTLASAADGSRIDRRQERQDLRTDHGIANDSLTARETQRIERRETAIDNLEDKALSDGELTNTEAAVVNHALNRQSRFIYRQKHDGQSR